MPEYKVVSADRYATSYWQRPSDFSFAKADTVIGLNGRELLEAARFLPVAFVKVEDGYRLVAIAGLEPNRSLLVADNGKWVGRYLPQMYRAYPFRLNKVSDSKAELLFDEDGGLLTGENERDADRDQYPFYDANKKPSKELRAVQEFLGSLHDRQLLTNRICDFLGEQKLLKDWEIKLRGSSSVGEEREENAKERKLKGMLCIDEEALNQLSAKSLAQLRDMGGLWVAYSQLFSMRLLPSLGGIAQARAKQANEEKFNLELDSGTASLSFDNL